MAWNPYLHVNDTAEGVAAAKRLSPVVDHEAEGDGTDNPTYCWCGRAFGEHLRRPR